MKLRKGKITLLLSKIGTDAEAAAEVLSIVATYLEHREQMPEPLADFIAQSFRSAASKYRDERLEELGFALGVTVRGAPRNAGATATVSSGEEATAMLNEMLAGSALMFRSNRPNAQLGLPTGQEQRVGQWTSDGMRPIPLDTSFAQAVEHCRENVKLSNLR